MLFKVISPPDATPRSFGIKRMRMTSQDLPEISIKPKVRRKLEFKDENDSKVKGNGIEARVQKLKLWKENGLLKVGRGGGNVDSRNIDGGKCNQEHSKEANMRTRIVWEDDEKNGRGGWGGGRIDPVGARLSGYNLWYSPVPKWGGGEIGGEERSGDGERPEIERGGGDGESCERHTEVCGKDNHDGNCVVRRNEVSDKEMENVAMGEKKIESSSDIDRSKNGGEEIKKEERVKVEEIKRTICVGERDVNVKLTTIVDQYSLEKQVQSVNRQKSTSNPELSINQSYLQIETELQKKCDLYNFDFFQHLPYNNDGFIEKKVEEIYA